MRKRSNRWRAFAALMFLCLPALPAAGDDASTHEAGRIDRSQLTRDLAEKLAAGQDIGVDLQHLEDDLAAGGSLVSAPQLSLPKSDVAQRFAAALDGLRRADAKVGLSEDALDELRTADLLAQAHFDRVRRTLEQHGIGGDIGGDITLRLDAAEAAHRERAGRVLLAAEALTDDSLSPAARAQLASELSAELDAGSALGEAARPILRASTLPYRRPALAIRAPQLTPTVLPAYLDAAALPASSSDMAATPDAPLSAAILAKAAELGHDYVAIYEYVEGLRREWYYGAMKGAEQTLIQSAGNDVDQAGLLIALLRASSVGARYVRGVADVPVASLADDFALTDPAGVPAALRLAGVPFEPVVQGGHVARVRFETTWVDAYVPYANYRGAVVDTMGQSWIPLAPAFARWQNQPSTGVFDAMGLDRTAFVDDYLQAPRDELPSEVIQDLVEAHLLATDPTQSWSDQPAVRQQRADPLGLLPSTLPFAVAAVTYEGADLPADLRHEVRLVLRRGAAASEPVVLEHRLPVRDLAGRRVTLSYLPATVDDHRVSNLFGGLSTVPLYLVRVRAQLRIDGRVVVVSEESFSMGQTQRLEMHLFGPGPSSPVSAAGPVVDHLVTVGAYAALGIEAQRQAWTPLPGDSAADTEFLGARLLSRMARDYAQRWTDSEDLLGRWLDVRVVRPRPALTAVSTDVEIGYLGELPFQLELRGVTIDAALRAAEPVSTRDVPADAKNWMRWSALEGSALEHRIFEDGFLIPGISADRVLAVAQVAGEEIVLLDDPGSPDLARLEHPSAVIDAIEDALRLGYQVRVPLRPITYVDWTGSGWWVEHASTGEAGYFLTGEIAGGMTAQKPEEWLLDWIGPIGSPYLPEASHDPLGAVRIEKLTFSDLQEGTVGEEFDSPVGVQVFDSTGQPVEGAQVLFEVLQGEAGLILDNPQEAASSLLVETDHRGLAAARVISGVDTSLGGIFEKQNPDDEHPQLALWNRVQASVTSYRGLVEIEAPFELLGFPGEANEIERVDAWGDTFFMTGVYFRPLQFQVIDEYGNSVANVDLTATSSYGAQIMPPCPGSDLVDERPPGLFDPTGNDSCGQSVPTLGDSCAVPSLSGKTTYLGLSVGFIAGNVGHQTQLVRVVAGGLGLSELNVPLTLHPGSLEYVDGECRPGLQWLSMTGLSLSPLGFNYSAVRAGDEYPNDLELHYYVHPYTSDSEPEEQDPSLWTGAWMIDDEINTLPQDAAQPSMGLVFQYPPILSSDDGASLDEPTIEVAGSPCATSGGFYKTRLRTSPLSANHGVHLQGFRAMYADGQCELQFPETVFDSGFAADATKGEDPPQNVAGLSFEIAPVLPETGELLPLNDRDFTTRDLEIEYHITPSNYLSDSLTAVLLDQEDRSIAEVERRGRVTAEGKMVFQRGLKLTRGDSYFVQLRANRGTASEVPSLKVPVQASGRLILDAADEFLISQEVDAPANYICELGTTFWFVLAEEAEVTLRLLHLQGIDQDGAPILSGDGLELISEETLPAGRHERTYTPYDVPRGEYILVLSAQSVSDSSVSQTHEGRASSRYTLRDSLPLGHTLIQGVDVWDGALTIQRTDFEVPAREAPLRFTRTYSGNRVDPGPLGIGWGHNWESKIVKTECNEWVLQGGEGSGARFLPLQGGEFQPLRGLHGTLKSDFDTGGLIYYTISGNKYHYTKLDGDFLWVLDSIEDPFGNRTVLQNEGNAKHHRLLSVTASSGESITFDWTYRETPLWEGWVIDAAHGPGGQDVTFEYDRWGNMTRSERNGLEVETFDYPVDGNLAARHRLLQVKNELTGAEDTYTYLELDIIIQQQVTVPVDAVYTVTQSDGGTTTFTYDQAALTDRGQAIVQTHVEDARGNEWIYDLNQYGAVERIEDPLGNESTTDWDLQHVKVKSRTDANGVTTSFTYDDYGNVKTEGIGGIHRSFDYVSPDLFSPPYIKNRVKKLTNRNGNVTTFQYGADGELKKESITVFNVDGTPEVVDTLYTYDLANGDLRTVTEPEGGRTTFQYNARGQRTQVTNAMGYVSTTAYDSRSRKQNMVDAEGRTTTFTYDALNRPKTRTLEDIAAIWKTDYFDQERRRVETDPEQNLTETWFDTRGRIEKIKNAENAEKHYEYDEEGNKNLESNWFGEFTTRADTIFVFDSANRLETRTEPTGRSTTSPMPADHCAALGAGSTPRITTYTHDPAGNLTSELITGPRMSPRRLQYGYDVLNRRTSEKRVDELGREVGPSWIFDGQGNKISSTDALGRERIYDYDELDRLKSESGPEGSGRELVYDKNSNLTEERTFNFFLDDNALQSEPQKISYKQIRTFSYDGLNRVESQTDAEGHRTTFVYDKVGNVTRQVDPRGNAVDTSYTAQNLPEEVTYFGTVRDEATELKLTRTYDKVGNLTTESEPNGRVVTHDYDRMNRRIKSYDALGTLSETTYTDTGKVRTATDANGNVTGNHYDLQDRLDLQEQPENRTACWVYDGMGNAVERYDARGSKTTSSYDPLERLRSTTDAQGFLETYTWDDVGNQLSVTNRRGYTTDYGYDDLNRQTQIEDPPLAADAASTPPGEEPLRQTVTREFDTVGNLLRETDRRGIVSAFEYDHENRQVQTERADLVIEEVLYDGNDNRIAVTDANRNITTFEYDQRNLLTRVNAPLLAISRFELDESGDRVKETDPEGRVIEREYDDRRRLDAEITGGDRTEFGYDGNGNLTSIDRPETPAWLRTYDGANRLKTVEDPDAGITEYDYDENGNLVTQTDAELKVTTFEYDELNRLKLKTLADETTASYDSYDENGNLTKRTDPNGTVFEMSYDELNRLAAMDLPGSLDEGSISKREFEYDRNNNLAEVTESLVGLGGGLVTTSTRRTYDDFDRLSTVTDRWGTTVIYGYDDNGNRTSVVGDGVSATYTYDALNRMKTVLSAVGATTYDYFKNSRLEKVTYPNGAKADYTWDPSNRLDTIENRVNTALVSRFDYDHDGNGNRIEQIEERTGDPAETTTYTYDLLDRLEEVAYPDQTTTYTYDGVGNRLTEFSSGVGGVTLADRTYTYNDRHQVETVSNAVAGGAIVDYVYDNNGNQISRTSTTDGTTLFTFDIFNRMTGVAKEGTELGSYAYNEKDLRIEKTSPEGTARYLYDDLSVLTRTLDGQKTKYYYGPDRLLAVADPTEGTGFYLQDALRSVVDIVSSDGALMASYKYDAWGNYREEADSPANPFGFTGHEHDDETGLIYAKARFYDPELGLFLSEDPAGDDYSNPPSLHKYLYAFQNPTVFVDPDGRIEWLSDAIGWIEGVQGDLKEVHQEFGRTELGQTFGGRQLQREAAKTTGKVSGVLGFVKGALQTANFAVNTALVGLEKVGADTGELTAQAKQETAESLGKVADTILTVSEDPLGAGVETVKAVAKEGFNTALALAEGDPDAIFEANALAAETATGLLTGAGATKALDKSKDVISRTLRKDGPDVDATVRVKDSGDGADVKSCFVAGTLVVTSDGLRPIEEVQLGDQVLSRDEYTGELMPKPVVQVFVTLDQPIFEVHVESSDGVAETLSATPAHPFWVEELGWIPAGRLRVGDRLISNTGGWLEVRQVRGSPRRETVYNFEVAETHTYFVGEAGAWVHNDCQTETQNSATQGRDERGRFLSKTGDELPPGGSAEAGALERRGLEKNTQRIPSASRKAEFRIPDGMDDTGRRITEIKDVDQLGLTSQLRDDVTHVTRDGVPGVVEVVVDTRTEISGPLRDAALDPDHAIEITKEALRGQN